MIARVGFKPALAYIILACIIHPLPERGWGVDLSVLFVRFLLFMGGVGISPIQQKNTK